MLEANVKTTHNTLTESVFKNKNFLMLFIGKVISMMGDQIYIFALGWYILSITKSGSKMGILLAIGMLPSVIIGPFAGVIADRFNRKTIMVLMDLIRCIIMTAMAAMLLNGVLNLWLLYIGTAVLEICGAVFNPAASAIIPDIVEEYQFKQAASMDQLVWSFCTILGMLTGGMLFGLIGINAIFLINAVSFLLSGILELNVKLGRCIHTNYQTKSSVLGELTSGYKFLKSNKGLLAIYIYFAALNFMMFPIANIYIPFIFNVSLKSNSIQLSLVQASFFIGLIIGALIISGLHGNRKFRKTILFSSLIVVLIEVIASITVTPIILSTLSVWNVVEIFVLLSILLGMSMSSFNIQIEVIFQKEVPDYMRGRVSALRSALVSGILPISYMISGFMSTKIPIYLIMLCTTFFIFVSVVILSRIKSVNEL